ncbi:MAG: tripartite tricarboxylate transporter TctB family protein [Spirochaetales bacterium]|nr:tripartite tricarboxylate transporter TctB family protein [Spirochaetales bacterium]
MEEKKLRQYDFITAVGLILFSIWELAQAFKMPMKDTYGGVQSEWYVSPALLPLIIGGGLMLLGAILLVNAVRSGGAASFFEAVGKSGKVKMTEPTRRVITVVFAFVSFIYLMIPHVDFFLSISLFLFYISASFYPDSDDFRKKMTFQFLLGMIALLILVVTGLEGVLKGILSYNVDILALLFLIYLNIYSRIMARKMDIQRKLIRQVTWISILVPLVRYSAISFWCRYP